MHVRHLLAAGLLLSSSGIALARTQDPDARAAATEAQMTDDERFQMLYGLMPISLNGMPSPAPETVKPTAGYIPGVPRLGIPDLVETDASLGVTNPLQQRPGDVATALPSGLAMAATFNPELAHAGGAMVGREARAKNFNILLGGGVNLTRDWYNGRNFEYLGEDPLLAGVMAGEAIRGTQSEGVVSTVKHFALNAQETLRHWTNGRIDEAALRESDLLAFQIAIERGQPGSVMCAYNLVNGAYSCGSDFLLNKVLKKDWGYKGWVMSDWGAVHATSYFVNGLDQQSGAQIDKQIWFGKPLRDAVANGSIPKERVSDAVRRILRALYAAGADIPREPAAIDYPAHAKIARAAAAEGIVLLKNDGVLPLAKAARSILVVGGYADRGVMSGGGSSQVMPVGGAAAFIPVGGPGFLSEFGKQLIMPSSPMKALQAALPDTKIEFESGYFAEGAAARAAKADMVIIFATQWETEGMDGPAFSLPQGQDALITTVAKANPNAVVVLETGNPVAMPWLDQVKAVVQAWYPGQEGGPAIADVLTGAVNPSGRLPMTFPASVEQMPRATVAGLGLADETRVEVNYREGADVGYRWFAKTGEKPLFPFGYGLSYTRFDHGPLTLKGGRTVTARFTVKNSGERAGADVPQLYLVDAAGEKMQRLAGFTKVNLKPGEKKTLTLTVDPRLLAGWSGEGWTVKGGSYGFALGTSASSLGPVATVKVDGQSLKP